uniref:Kinetochore protein SPC25 n=2 Tax=Bursaphelenchus xylophilus TaxID=6326 RepID=A0A1I7SA06_BURXY
MSDELLREMAEVDLECERQFGKYLHPNRVVKEEPKSKPLEEKNRELEATVKELRLEVAFGKRKIQQLESMLNSGQGSSATASSEVQVGIAKRDRHIAKLQEQLQQAKEFAEKRVELKNQLESALEEVKRLQDQLEAKENRPARDPDATQIVRFLKDNPIETAHRRSTGLQSLSSSGSSAQSFGPTDCLECKGLQAKIKDLQEEISERRRISRRYMDTVQKLTGYKVRLRNEDMVKVVTVFDEKHEMLFGVNTDPTSRDGEIELLQCRGWERHKDLTARLGPVSAPVLLAHILIAQFEKEDGTTLFQETATYCQTADSTTQILGK